MLVIKTTKEHYMITDMDYVSYSTENIQELLHLFSFVDNKRKSQAADSLKFACTLFSQNITDGWLPWIKKRNH